MQKSPIPQGFLHLLKVRISICIVLFNADFIEMQSTKRESQGLGALSGGGFSTARADNCDANRLRP
jgi:hypothetical protein